MRPTLTLLCVLLLWNVNLCQSDKSVIFAAIIYRHGDRTPVDPYPTDPWGNVSFWPTSWGQLTDTGKLQHLQLGAYFRDRYKHLLSDVYNPEEIYIRSTDYDRTIMSALSNLAGMYPIADDSEWSPGLSWQPIPVHSVPKMIDEVMCMDEVLCPKYDEEMKALLSSDIYKEMDRENAPLYEYLTSQSGRKVDSLRSVLFLYDTLHIENLYNFTLPNWTDSVYPDKLLPISEKCFLTDTYTPTMARMKSGPLIKMISNQLQAAAANKSLHNLAIYSGHDTTIANTLNSLGLFKPHLPSYASSILFELVFVENSTEPAVRLLYQNEIMEIPGCGKLCPLSQWEKQYSWFINSDHMADCKLNVNLDSWWRIAWLILGWIVVTTFIYCLLKNCFPSYFSLPNDYNNFEVQFNKNNIETPNKTEKAPIV